MAYIGQGIKEGTFAVLDTSGNTYNGSNTTFSLGTQVGSPAQLLVSHDGVIQKAGTDYSLASGGTQITFSTAPASGASIFIVEISGAVGGPLDSDLNGTELILDTDGDTSITADTDDQIDIKVAGTDQITIKDGALSPVTDNDIDLGTSSLEFKDAFFDGTVTTDGLTVSGTPSFADGSIAIADLDIDGGTDIGADIADSDLFIIDDGAGGTNRKVAASRIKTYAGGAGLNLTASLTVSSNTSTADLNGCFNTTYDNYLVVFDYTPSENGVNPKIRFKDTSNNALTGSNYTYAFHGNDQFGNEENSVAHDDSSIQPGQGTFGNQQIDFPAIAGALYFNSPMNSSHQTEVTGNTTQFGNNGDNRSYSVGIRFEAQTQVAGLQFFFASGSVNNLTCRVYGLTNS